MACFGNLFSRKKRRDKRPPSQQGNTNNTNNSNDRKSSGSATARPVASVAGARTQHNPNKVRMGGGASQPVRPDSPRPQPNRFLLWSSQPRNHYPPNATETRNRAPCRPQQYQHQHQLQQPSYPKPARAAFPPTVNTRRREDDAHATGPTRERRRRERQQQKQEQQQKQQKQQTQQQQQQPPSQRLSTSSAQVKPLALPNKGKGKAKATAERKPDGPSSRPDGSSNSSRDRNNGYADPPVSVPLRKYTLLDDDADDTFLDAAAAALSRKLERCPDRDASGRPKPRDSFYLAAEQLRQRAVRQQQRQQQRRPGPPPPAAVAAPQPRTTSFDKRMEEAARALDNLLSTSGDSSREASGRPVPRAARFMASEQQRMERQGHRREIDEHERAVRAGTYRL